MNKVVSLLIVLIIIFLPIISVYLCKERKEFLKEYNKKYYVKENAELNEVDFLRMTIKEGTLTRTGATLIITSSIKNKYIDYDLYYRLSKKVNNEWQEIYSDYWENADIVSIGREFRNEI